MNAYELADGLSKMYIETDNHGLFNKRIQNMLRQQAQAIATLSDRIAELEKSQMAWYEAGKFVSPQIKELSDEEIMAMAKDYIHYTEYRLAIQFARAILKKASKK